MTRHPLVAKWLWFIAIWLGSIAVLGVVAYAIRLVI